MTPAFAKFGTCRLAFVIVQPMLFYRSRYHGITILYLNLEILFIRRISEKCGHSNFKLEPNSERILCSNIIMT